MKNLQGMLFAITAFLLLNLSGGCKKDSNPDPSADTKCTESLVGVWGNYYASATPPNGAVINMVPGTLTFDLKQDGTGTMKCWGINYVLTTWTVAAGCSGFDFKDNQNQTGHFDILGMTGSELEIEGDMLNHHFYAFLARQ